MANYTTTADVVITANAKQAAQILDGLNKKAQSLEKQMQAAATVGDKASMQRIQRELNSTNKIIEQLQGSAATAEQTLRRMDRATPKELQKAIRTLQRQLNGMERGSEAWNAHVKKIQKLKAELAAVNRQMQAQSSLWERFNRAMNSAQTTILAVGGAMTGLIMAGRKAVSAYADMEEQLASTQKFTGMTRQEVEQLNEEFKKMDTRLAREQLNELAQEAGRLGFNKVDTVKEYVDAASVINVALDELGDGATQTIAKLTNIFGVQEKYGVKDAMLKVGATVNELSQNCTAASPYLVEFAQRMAGVGSTANMTIPEIMAFAATLDAHGQKVEMSATALQRVIMELYQNTGDIAQKVGLNVNELSETMQRSTSQGVIMFLQALKDIGQDGALAVLAPLFKDLGLDGARVSSVLANLSDHLDFLKWEMQEANKAFDEGTSAANEYAIFNNTVQASIDKARGKFNELAVSLGEQLYPAMKYVYTSSSAFMRVLSVMVEWFIKYRENIAQAAIAVASCTVAFNAAKIAHAAWNAVTIAGRTAKNAWRAAVLAANIVQIAFTKGIKSATRAMQLYNATVKGNPLGVLFTVVTAVVGAIAFFSRRTNEAAEAQKRVNEAVLQTNQAMQDERAEIDKLFGKLDAAEKGTAEYYSAKKAIISQFGQYLNGMSEEIRSLDNVAAAYRVVTREAENAARARGLAQATKAADDAYNEEIKDAVSLMRSGLNGATVTEKNRNAEGGKMERQLSIREAAKWGSILLREAQAGGFSKGTNDFLKKLGVYRSKGGGFDGRNSEVAEALTKIFEASAVRSQEYADAKMAFASPDNEFQGLNAAQLQETLDTLKKFRDHAPGVKLTMANGNTLDLQNINDIADAIKQLEGYIEYVYDTMPEPGDGGGSADAGGGGSIVPPPQAKDKGGTAARFVAEDDWRKAEEAKAKIAYATGETSFSQYTQRMDDIAVEYFSKLLQRQDLSVTERLDLQAKMWEEMNKADVHGTEQLVAEENRTYEEQLDAATVLYKQRLVAAASDADARAAAERAFTETVELIELAHLKKLAQLAQEGSEERLRLERQFHDKELAAQQRHVKQMQDEQEKLARVKAQYFGDNTKDKADKYASEIDALKTVYTQELQIAGSNAEERMRIEEAFQQGKKAIAEKYGQDTNKQTSKSFKEAMQGLAEWFNSEGGKAFTGAFNVMVSGMSNIFSGLTSLIQAECDIQVAAVEKRYDKEISKAEGNSYKTKKLEKQKEKEIAKIKNDASKKQYTMQVIQAIAQTAQNAISAYGSALMIGPAGLVLAPIAAGLAIAAGMIQVAALKKQQQAAEAQGYAAGGFTPDGEANEPAGIVHAGEWVASQKLTRDKRVRPLLEALDQAQRNNTVGSIRMEDVSRAIIAPAAIAASSEQMPAVAVQQAPSVTVVQNAEYAATMARLAKRLDEPFMTVNSVTGDFGMKRAQSEYDRLMRNKTPKSKRS